MFELLREVIAQQFDNRIEPNSLLTNGENFARSSCRIAHSARSVANCQPNSIIFSSTNQFDVSLQSQFDKTCYKWKIKLLIITSNYSLSYQITHYHIKLTYKIRLYQNVQIKEETIHFREPRIAVQAQQA